MYQITKNQLDTLVYIIERLTVTGAGQATLLSNLGRIADEIKAHPAEKEVDK